MKQLLAILLTLVFVAPVMAEKMEWDLYGSARVSMFMVDNEKEQGDGENDDTDLNNDLQGNARIGANVKVRDNLSGRFEYGAGGGNANIRLLYGVYNFGGGSLLVGQDWHAANANISSQAANGDTNLLEGGDYCLGRVPQIRLAFGDFQLALIQNRGGVSGVDRSDATLTYDEDDITIPHIEAVYTMNVGDFMFKPFASYQTFDIETSGAGQESLSVDSYAVGATVKFKLGPASLAASGYYGQNLSNHGVWFKANDSAAKAHVVDDSIEDATGYGGALVFNMPFSDTIGFEAGLGFTSNEVDIAGGKKEDDGVTYYAQLPITLASGVYIVPEISIFDDGKTKETGQADDEEGTQTWIGAKFQINF